MNRLIPALTSLELTQNLREMAARSALVNYIS